MSPRARGQHLMHAYAQEFPAQRVAAFVDEGRLAGEPAIVFATQEHARQVQALVVPSIGVREVTYVDASEALARCMVAGWPDADRFDETVGSVVRSAAGLGAGRVRAFGEMVSLLCERGMAEAALELERLWNRLGLDMALTLLCAYHEAALVEAGQVQELIVAQHARIFGEPEPAR